MILCTTHYEGCACREAAHRETEAQRDMYAGALEAIIAEPWLSGGLDACTIASAALYPAGPLT